MKSAAGLWIGVGGAFALLLAAWTALFFCASQAQVESVPLAAANKAGVAKETP